LASVKQSIETAARHAHVELTTLVIPGENDDDGEMEALARFAAGINPEMPLHLSRFFPRHQMRDKEPTPIETMKKLKTVAERHLKYVYLGNVY
jgi:pyruvate formate lyase activating enzyme